MKKSRMIAALSAAVVSVSALAVSASAYTGYLCFQTGQWSYRNALDDASTGAASDYYGAVIMNGGSAEEGTYPDYDDYYDYDLGTYAIPVTWTNASIDGAGTYTVAIDDFDWSLDGSSAFNGAFISTDIPKSAGLVPTSITIYIDGNAEKTITKEDIDAAVGDDGKNPYYEFRSDDTNMQINWSNPWNPIGAWDGSYPTSGLKVEFTLAAEGGAAAETTTAAAGDVAAATDSSKGSPDTGIADVAAVAGIALVAAGAFVVAKKRG